MVSQTYKRIKCPFEKAGRGIVLGGNMQSKVISGYMDEQGHITQMPSKKKKKLYVLCCLADQIPACQTGNIEFEVRKHEKNQFIYCDES